MGWRISVVINQCLLGIREEYIRLRRESNGEIPSGSNMRDAEQSRILPFTLLIYSKPFVSGDVDNNV